jgi:ribokinase
MPVITVIGSLNVDMVTVTSRIPEGGETILARAFSSGWGGKGANQAVAAARLSEKADSSTPTLVRMIGAVGDDAFGSAMLNSLQEDGIDITGVKKVPGISTGAATVLVEEMSGQNRILVIPGANATLKWNEDLVGSQGYGDVAIFQLETHMKVVLAHTSKAHAAGAQVSLHHDSHTRLHLTAAQVILNPSPAAKLPDTAYRNITHLILNSNEAELICDQPPGSVSAAATDLTKISDRLIHKGVKTVVITLGPLGAFYQTESRTRTGQRGVFCRARKAQVVDTTGAGDTFVGAYAVRIATAKSQTDVIQEAVEFAIRASGMSVEMMGAQKAIPHLKDVMERMAKTQKPGGPAS